MVVDFTAFDPFLESCLLEALSLFMDFPIKLFHRDYSDNQEPRGWPFLRRQNNLLDSEAENKPRGRFRRRRNCSSSGSENREQESEALRRPRT